MPTIHIVNPPLANRAIILDAVIAKATAQPLDDLPLVSSVDDGLALLGQTSHASVFCFRIPDDPCVIVAWRRFGSAALIHTFHKRRLVFIDAILLGNADDDAAAVERARSAMALECAEVDEIIRAERPTVVRMSQGNDSGIASILALILFVPMMCDALHND